MEQNVINSIEAAFNRDKNKQVVLSVFPGDIVLKTLTLIHMVADIYRVQLGHLIKKQGKLMSPPVLNVSQVNALICVGNRDKYSIPICTNTIFTYYRTGIYSVNSSFVMPDIVRVKKAKGGVIGEMRKMLII